MAIEVYTGPTAKEFRFMVEINGFPAALVQSFDPGSRHHAVAERGGAGMNHPFKEAGMITFDNCILYAVRPLEGTCQNVLGRLDGSGSKSKDRRRRFDQCLHEEFHALRA